MPSPLARALTTFFCRPSGSQRPLVYVMASPDPRRSAGFQSDGAPYGEYLVKIGEGRLGQAEGHSEAEVFACNPHFAHAYNDQKDGSQATSSERLRTTGWISVPDHGGSPNPTRKALVAFIDRFPTYDLSTEEGARKAIEEVSAAFGGEK